MSFIALGVTGAGLLVSGYSAYEQGKSNKKKQNQLEALANRPGIDTGAITEQSLADMERLLPRAAKLAAETGNLDQARLMAQEELALPGAGAARAKDLEAINRLFADDKEWLAGVQRRGAAFGLGRGLGGSQAAQIGTLRLSDQESMQRTQLGTGLLAGLLGTLRISQSPGVAAFLGPDAKQLAGIRSNERSASMGIEAGAIQQPGMTDALAGFGSSLGGMAFGVGLGGWGNKLMEGGGGSGSMAAAPRGGYRTHPMDQFDPQAYMNRWGYPGPG